MLISVLKMVTDEYLDFYYYSSRDFALNDIMFI